MPHDFPLGLFPSRWSGILNVVMRSGHASNHWALTCEAMMLRSVCSAAVCCLVFGCASIIHGGHEDVGISSAPTAAKVSVDNKDLGVTPLVAKLSRKDNHIIHVELAGYQPFDATLTRKVSGWVWGNLVFGGLPGLAVDAISGGLYKLSPDQVSAQLAKQGASVSHSGDDLAVLVVLRPDPTWQKVGQLDPVAR